MRSWAIKLIIRFQALLVHLAFASRRLSKKSKPIWILGTGEICGSLQHYGAAIPNSRTFCFYHDGFNYDLISYTHSAPLLTNTFHKYIYRIIWQPLLFGWYLQNSLGVIYLGSSGFLLQSDEREFEFSYIKKKKRKLICVFSWGVIYEVSSWQLKETILRGVGA